MLLKKKRERRISTTILSYLCIDRYYFIARKKLLRKTIS